MRRSHEAIWGTLSCDGVVKWEREHVSLLSDSMLVGLGLGYLPVLAGISVAPRAPSTSGPQCPLFKHPVFSNDQRTHRGNGVGKQLWAIWLVEVSEASTVSTLSPRTLIAKLTAWKNTDASSTARGMYDSGPNLENKCHQWPEAL